MNNDISSDLYRLKGKKDLISLIKARRSKSFLHLYYYRKRKNSVNRISAIYYRIRFHFAYKKSGLELPIEATIGEGALFIHPYGITINRNSIIGKNFTILKGATIGSIKDGRRKGTPKIGDNVYVGLNATVVGGITIGNDVVIAPNTFVNFDVPSHSVVLGNPGVVHKKDYATKGYITNAI